MKTVAQIVKQSSIKPLVEWLDGEKQCTLQDIYNESRCKVRDGEAKVNDWRRLEFFHQTRHGWLSFVTEIK